MALNNKLLKTSYETIFSGTAASVILNNQAGFELDNRYLVSFLITYENETIEVCSDIFIADASFSIGGGTITWNTANNTSMTFSINCVKSGNNYIINVRYYVINGTSVSTLVSTDIKTILKIKP